MGIVDANDYLLPKAADDADLSSWASVLPNEARILCTNLFGDVFLVDGVGAVHMLERGGCSVTEIAPSEENFWRSLDADHEGWQLRPLADACRAEGKMLGESQCYAFAMLPLLGGDYTPENVWVASWHEWFSFTADMFHQTKDLPDGAAIELKFLD